MVVSALDFDRLGEIARQRRESFERAQPFPHVAIDDFIPAETADAVLAEIQSTTEGWDTYRHYNENKEAITNLDDMPPRTRALVEALNSAEFVRFVEQITGIDNLAADRELDGAGVHKTRAGGFLNLHTDFLCHTRHDDWSRQVNLLFYLNRDWQPAWNGDLELWNGEVSQHVASIEPLFNRCVLFHTTNASYHGHPSPLACPPEVERISIALYYFRRENVRQPLSATHYRALPSDSQFRRALVAIDRSALRAYSFVRRHTPLRDGLVARILKRL